ncbi:hypothetical protein K1T73_05235 [Roseovarius sp. SCSIO 43702]|uniref:hypothetical protein n=1 Tax=Roseovarius sp. SCSIO 43702 TaxID=2823043 RepID=UPI001C73494E|nr:hypothetical protein [Roseovarius sp. SCSIO 43702]QYX57793.1 hypothetical protein K1T73_05235 [Roseovarius sp. SCSIO 43702]
MAAHSDIHRVFLVLESDPLIATDLAEALTSRFDARVLHASTSAQCSELLVGVDHIDTAFLELRPSDYEAHPIRAALDRLVGRTVFTVGEGELQRARSNGWHMLTRPFTDAMIFDVLSEH